MVHKIKSLCQFTLFIALIANLIGCGNIQTADESAVQESTMESNTTDEIPVSNTDIEISETNDIQWDYAYDFSEDLAWVKFRTGEIEGELNSYEHHYYGVINKSGEMIFRIDSDDISAVTQFSNGYSYVSYSDKTDVIDTNGITVKSYPINENQCIRAYGDGYVLTEEHYSDFDSNGYVYTIYSPQGDMLETIETEDYSSFVRYFGKGIFGCNGNLYFSEEQKQLPMNEIIDFYNQLYFYEDVASLKIEPSELILISSEGEIFKNSIPIEDSLFYAPTVKNGLCIIKINDYMLATYNLATQTFSTMSEDDAGKIVWGDIQTSLVFDDSGKIALTMQGSDENYYVGIFDTEWSMISEPIQVRGNSNFVRGFGYSDSGYAFSYDRLIVSNIGISENPETCVYDGNGNLIYTLDEKSYYGIAPYSDGVACVSSWEGRYKGNGYAVHLDGNHMMELDDEESPKYLDLDGNLLFDKINMDSVVDR